MFSVWHSDKPSSVAQPNQPRCWPTYEELFVVLSSRMARDGYKIVKARSHRGRINGAEVSTSEMVRVDLVCDKGGRPYMCHATKHRTTTKKTGCPWKAKAVKRKSVGGWTLDIVVDEHNHEPGTPEQFIEEEEDAEGEADMDGGGAAAAAAMAPPPITHSQAPSVALVPPNEPAMANGTILPPPFDAAPPATAADATTRPDHPPDWEDLFISSMTRESRLSGDTFHKIKQNYRKMTRHQRVNVQAHIQFHLAALFAIENEDVQRQNREDIANRRHAEAAVENRRLVEHQNQERIAAIASGQTIAPRKRPASLVSAVVIDDTCGLDGRCGGGRVGEVVAGRGAGEELTDLPMVMEQRDHEKQPHHQPPLPHHQPPLPSPQRHLPPPPPHHPHHPHQHVPQYPQTPVPLPSFSLYPTGENGVMHQTNGEPLYPSKRHRGHRPRKL